MAQHSHKLSAPAESGFVPTNASKAFAREGAAWCEVTELEPTGLRVRLGGLFRPAWLAALCSGLAGHRVSIDHAHARITHDGSWIAELGVVALDLKLDLPALHFIELADTANPHSSALHLQGYELALSADHGGTLKLSIEAQDRLGLLGGLLSQLASLALYPVEMHIETRGGYAYDCLWLSQMGASRPSTGARHALDRLLSGLMQP